MESYQPLMLHAAMAASAVVVRGRHRVGVALRRNAEDAGRGRESSRAVVAERLRAAGRDGEEVRIAVAVEVDEVPCQLDPRRADAEVAREAHEPAPVVAEQPARLPVAVGDVELEAPVAVDVHQREAPALHDAGADLRRLSAPAGRHRVVEPQRRGDVREAAACVCRRRRRPGPDARRAGLHQAGQAGRYRRAEPGAPSAVAVRVRALATGHAIPPAGRRWDRAAPPGGRAGARRTRRPRWRRRAPRRPRVPRRRTPSPCTGRSPMMTPVPSARPATPPTRARMTDSSRNWRPMSPRFAPNARRTPISRRRSATEISMMFITPIPPTMRLMLPTAPSSSVIRPSCDSICAMSCFALLTSISRSGARSPNHVLHLPHRGLVVGAGGGAGDDQAELRVGHRPLGGDDGHEHRLVGLHIEGQAVVLLPGRAARPPPGRSVPGSRPRPPGRRGCRSPRMAAATSAPTTQPVAPRVQVRQEPPLGELQPVEVRERRRDALHRAVAHPPAPHG